MQHIIEFPVVKDFRERFIESFLFEQPKQIAGAINLFGPLDREIKELIQIGYNPAIVTDNVLKIEMQSMIYYWSVSENNTALIIQLEKTQETLIVNTVEKKVSGIPPWATDLYDAILKDRGKSITIRSDSMLTDGGFAIWKRLLQNGRKISLYNTTNPGSSFNEIKTIAELQSFFNVSDNSKQYRFVLSENWQELGETMSLFFARRNLELSGRL